MTIENCLIGYEGYCYICEDGYQEFEGSCQCYLNYNNLNGIESDKTIYIQKCDSESTFNTRYICKKGFYPVFQYKAHCECFDRYLYSFNPEHSKDFGCLFYTSIGCVICRDPTYVIYRGECIEECPGQFVVDENLLRGGVVYFSRVC